MKRVAYRGSLINVGVHNIRIEGRGVRREIIEHPGAAAMLGFDERGRVVLVEQYRFPHGYVLEIPAGTMERGEEPSECAHREMLEETGYKAGRMVPLISFYPSIGYNSEIIHCFLAKNLKKVSEINPDNDEFIRVRKMGLERLIAAIRSGRIKDSKTICAVLTYAAKKRTI